MTQDQVIKSFWQHLHKSNRAVSRQRNLRDLSGMHTSDVRNAFVNYVEDLRSKKEISDELANTIKLNQNKP